MSEIALSRRGAPRSTRRVVAASCAEASDAVAVIIVVTLGQAVAATESNSNPRESASATTTQKRDGASGPPASRDTPSDAGSAPSSETETAPWRSRYGVVVAGQSFVAPAPGVMLGVALFVSAGLDRPSPWSPALVLGATSAWRNGIDVRGGTASFVLDAATLDLCPLRFASASVETRLCASALGGRLTAEGTDTVNAAGAVARPFFALGGAGTLGFALGQRFEASARFAAGASLVRDEFRFEPVVFHEVPSVTLSASVGLGMRIP